MASSVGEIIRPEPGWNEEDPSAGNIDTFSSHEQKDLTLETLHSHAIEHVITKLVPQDLCSFSETSKSIKAKTNLPKFWKTINVSQIKIKQEGLPQLFLIDKFKQVQRIDLSNMNFTYRALLTNLRAIADSSVIELVLDRVRVAKVPTELLAKIATQLTKISLSYSDPTTDQCLALLRACVTPATMTHVNLEGCHNLRRVPVKLLVKGLGNLTQINLNYTLSVSAAVVEMCVTSPSLVDLSLQGVDLTDVPPQTLGQAAGSLTKIDLSFCRLTSVQCCEVLTACIASPTLNHVDISGNDLQPVPAELLAKAVGNLETVNLEYTKLTTEQSTAVVEMCKSSSSKLTDVDLSCVNLSQVSPQLLMEAIHNVQRISLKCAKFTAEQRIVILNAVITSNTTVRLYFGGDEKASLTDGLFIQAKGTGRLLDEEN